ncbi:MAG: hypothetical protein SF028_10615 [Candidatus Sumerlaeia bacterium]|nr:hypothetical protein [Candidatus Sumerlaeia bacterium]
MKKLLLMASLLAAAASAPAVAPEVLDWGIAGQTMQLGIVGADDFVAFDTQRGVVLKVVPRGQINSLPGGGVAGAVDIVAVNGQGAELARMDNIPVGGRVTTSLNYAFTAFPVAAPSMELGLAGVYNTRQSITLSGRMGDAAFSFVGGYNGTTYGGTLENESIFADTAPPGPSGTVQIKLGQYFGSGVAALSLRRDEVAFFETTTATFQDLDGRLRNWRGDAVVVETNPSGTSGAPLVTPGGTTNVTTVWYRTGSPTPGYVVSSGSNASRGYSGTYGGYIGVTEAGVASAIGTDIFNGVPSLEAALVYQTFNARGSYTSSARSTYSPAAIQRLVERY